MSSENLTANPFPGLRPFDSGENHLFFGRDGQSDDLLRRLRRQRFIAVVGTSGSGKSSLVRAGLLPSLHGGFMLGAGSNWRVAVFRPGNDPIANLAQALRRRDVLGGDEGDAGIQLSFTLATLRRSALGLIDVVRQARVPAQDNLLVVVDQFEELFRVRGAEHADDAAAFVKLLLEATRQTELPVYVLITMRSDFLGDCTQFRDLPEAINDGQYLIPRMTRDQRREAITGPVAVGGAEIAPRLVNRLLNEAGDNSDQLPLLQHALMRTWQQWEKVGGAGEPLDLPHYEAVGGFADAISQHAEEVYGELQDERARRIAEILFKLLTERGPDNREIRRPTRLSEVCAVADASEEEVRAVVEVFRGEGRSFLMPPPGTELRDDTFIDISHESLIRGWRRLQRWVDDEALSARIFRRLAETAALYRGGEAGLWRDPDLSIALAWRDRPRPNAAWGARYSPGFSDAMQFLDESQRARDAELAERDRVRRKTLRLTQALAAVLLLGLCVSLAFAGLAFIAYQQARENFRRARDAEVSARAEKDRAERALTEAEQARRRAEEEKSRADELAKTAEQKAEEASANLRAAKDAEKRATRSAEDARQKAEEARAHLKAAELATARAEEARVDALAGRMEARENAQRAYDLGLRFRRNIIESNASIYGMARRLGETAPSRELAHWLSTQAAAMAALGDRGRAITFYTDALRQEPDKFSALDGRGYQYLLNQQPRLALRDIDRALEINDKAPGLYLNKTFGHAFLGEYGEAMKTLRGGIEMTAPLGYWEYSQQGVAHEIENATGHKSVHADSNAALTAFHYGMVHLAAASGSEEFAALLEAADTQRDAARKNRAGGADAERGEAADQPDAYLYALNWSLMNQRMRPDDYGSLVAQGVLWQRAKFCEKAAQAFQRFRDEHAKRADPRYAPLADWLARRPPTETRAAGGDCITGPPSREKMPRVHLLDGVEYSLNDPSRAHRSYTKAIELEPSNPDFVLERMRFRYNQADYVGAKQDAEQAIGISPKAAVAYLYRALAKVQLNSEDTSAVEDARTAIKLNPAAVPALNEDDSGGKLLVDMIALANTDEAIDVLERSAKYSAPTAHHYYLMAKLLNDKGRYAEGLKKIGEAVALNSGKLEYYEEKVKAEEGLRAGRAAAGNASAAAPAASAPSIAGQRTKAREFSEAADSRLSLGRTGEALYAYGESLRLLDAVVRQKGDEDVRCDVEESVDKIFRIVRQLGSKEEAVAYVKTLMGELKAIGNLVQARLQRLSDAP